MVRQRVRYQKNVLAVDIIAVLLNISCMFYKFLELISVKSLLTKSAISLMLLATASLANADVCDYTPSNLIGNAATTVGTAVAAGGATAGLGMQAAGFYTLVHAGSGLTMLGSTAAGASAAGTVGIIAGTGGVVGAVGAFLMAPVTIIVGGITVIGVGAYEGVCYFQVERIEAPELVLEIVSSVAANDSSVSVEQSDDGPVMVLVVDDKEERHLIEDLYIADGNLKVRSWGPDESFGPILFTSEGTASESE